MVGRKELANLQLRKRTLVLESTLHRAVLETEWQNLQGATAWARSARQTFRQARPWLLLLAPLAGLLVARGSAPPLRPQRRFLSVLKWLRTLLSIGETFRNVLAENPPKPSAKS